MLGGLLGMAVFVQSTLAHSPHDDIFDVHLSPDYSDSGRLYTIVRSLVLRSDDRASTWKRLIHGLDHKYMLYDMDVAESDGRLYVTSLGDGIYRSGDGGEHWQRVNRGLASLVVDLVAASPSRPGLVFATDVHGGFYRSENAGNHWQRVEAGFGKVGALSFLPSGKSHVVAGDDRGKLYHSSDAGVTWEPIHHLEGREGITALEASGGGGEPPVLLMGTSAGRVLRSDDAGRSFTTATVTAGSQPIVSLDLSPTFQQDQLVFSSVWDEGFYVSEDGGRTWHQRTKGLSRNPQSAQVGRPSFSEVTVSPMFGSDRTLFLSAYDGLFRSTDAGESWEQLSTLSEMNVIALSVAPSDVETSELALTTYLWGAYRSPGDGTDWQPIYNDVRDPYLRDEGIVRMFQVAFSPSFKRDRTFFTSTWYRFFRSTNGGESWQELSHDPAPPGERRDQGSYYAISPSFHEDETVFVGLKNGRILKSVDRGESFTVVNNVGHMVGSLVTSPAYAEDHTIFAADTRGIHVSQDGGGTWEFSRLVPASFSMDLPASAGYPADAAKQWEAYLINQREKEFEIKVAVSPAYAADRTVFAGTAAGLFRSLDGGRTWSAVGTGSELEGAFIEAVAVSPDYADDSTVLVSARGPGLFRSQDGGRSFAAIGPDLIEHQRLLANYPGITPKFPAVLFSPHYASNDTVYGFSGTEVLRSQDGGETWQPLPGPRVGLVTRLYTWGRYMWAERLSRRDKMFGAAVGLTCVLGVGFAGVRKWKLGRILR